MKIRAKALRSTKLGIVGRSVDVDASGYVVGLTEEEGARLLTMAGFEDEDPVPVHEPEAVPSVPETAEEVKESAPVVRKGPGRPKKGG